MQQARLSASPSTTAEIPPLCALPAPRLRRLDELTPELAALICDVIRLDGLADHFAGALAGVSRATLTKWKAEDEAFALALEAARAQFELGLLRAIRHARKSDGSPDWRAQAWLLTHASSDGFAKPAGAAKDRPAQEPNVAAQKCAILPEMPERPVRQPAGAPLAGRIAPADEKPSFLPETGTSAGGGKQRAA
jgi:hypothetical protein